MSSRRLASAVNGAVLSQEAAIAFTVAALGAPLPEPREPANGSRSAPSPGRSGTDVGADMPAKSSHPPLANQSRRPASPHGCDTVLEREAARRLADAGRLTEDVLAAAILRGDTTATLALLATAAGVAPSLVERAIKLRSTKGLVSLVWRAGFSMQVAPSLQMLLTRLEPGAVLVPTADATFPLAENEMRWQIEFLAHAQV